MNERNELIVQKVKAKHLFDYALTILLFGFAIFLAIGIFVYTRPINVIDIDPLQTDKLVYKQGEKLELFTVGQAFETARSSYDRRFICNDGMIERRDPIDVLVLNTTPRPPAEVTTEFTVSERITGESCVLQITSSAEVSVLPFVTKTVTEVFESNEFAITEAE